MLTVAIVNSPSRKCLVQQNYPAYNEHRPLSLPQCSNFATQIRTSRRGVTLDTSMHGREFPTLTIIYSGTHISNVPQQLQFTTQSGVGNKAPAALRQRNDSII